MAAAPVLPVSPAPTPNQHPFPKARALSTRLLHLLKPSPICGGSAAWWAPFLLMVIISTVFVYVAGQKIGFRKIMENQMQAQPKAQERLEKLPADQREQQTGNRREVYADHFLCLPGDHSLHLADHRDGAVCDFQIRRRRRRLI